MPRVRPARELNVNELAALYETSDFMKIVDIYMPRAIRPALCSEKCMVAADTYCVHGYLDMVTALGLSDLDKVDGILVTRVSLYSASFNTFEIPLTLEEYRAAVNEWIHGKLIQDAFPALSTNLREFIQSGMTAGEWDEMFSDDEEDATI